MNHDNNHIQNSTHEGNSWCGEAIEVGEFFFSNTEMAVINGNIHGRINPCVKCVIQIIHRITMKNPTTE